MTRTKNTDTTTDTTDPLDDPMSVGTVGRILDADGEWVRDLEPGEAHVLAVGETIEGETVEGEEDPGQEDGPEGTPEDGGSESAPEEEIPLGDDGEIVPA